MIRQTNKSHLDMGLSKYEVIDTIIPPALLQGNLLSWPPPLVASSPFL